MTLIDFAISKLRKPRLREPFDKQHGKRAKALLESASQYFFHIH